MTAAVLALIVFAVYRGTLVNGFVYDDVPQIIGNPFVFNPRLWKSIFSENVWAFMGVHSFFYRPLQFAAYWVLYRFVGPAPGYYHLLNVLVCVATVWVIYRLGREITSSAAAGFFGALLWGLHPAHVEVVGWISALADAGAGLFYLLGFLLFVRAERAASRPLARHVAAALAFLPALFFKEIAISFVLMIPVFWFFVVAPASPKWGQRALRWLPYLTATGIYLVIRYIVLGRLTNDSHLFATLPRVLASSLGLMGGHARLFFWPPHLNSVHSLFLADSLRSPWPWATLAVLAGALALRRRQPVLGFLTMWWLVALLPVLDIRNVSTPQIADRFSYIPSAGPCLAIAFLALVKLPEWMPRARPERPALAFLLVVLGLWGAECLRLIPYWRSDEALRQLDEKREPNSAVVHLERADELFYREKKLDAAAREYELAIRLNNANSLPFLPFNYTSYIGLGRIAGFRGDRAGAQAWFERAVRLLPYRSEALDALGALYFPREDYARAAEYFARAVAANPYDVVGRFYLGTCWMKLGKHRDAAAQFHAAWSVDPTYYAAYEAEARALESAGEPAEAARVRGLKPPAEP